MIVDESKGWHDFGEDIRYFIEDLSKGEDVEGAYDWDMEYEQEYGWTELQTLSIPAQAPIIPDENGKYPNVFGAARVTVDFSDVTFTPVNEKEATCEEDGNNVFRLLNA